MIPRPLDVEDTPKLVDLRLLRLSPTTRIDCQRNQCQRYGTTVAGLDAEIDSRSVPDVRLPLQSLKVLGFGLFAFAEDHQRLLGPTGPDPPSKGTRLGLAASLSHLGITWDDAQGAAQCDLGEFRPGTEPALQVGLLKVQRTADLVPAVLGQCRQRGRAVAPLLGQPHFVTVEMVQQAGVMSRKDELGAARIRQRVLEQFKQSGRQLRVQARVDLIEEQDLTTPESVEHGANQVEPCPGPG